MFEKQVFFSIKNIILLFLGFTEMGFGQSEWTIVNLDTNYHLASVIYGNGQFVTVGTFGTILTSTNGTMWTKRNSDKSRYLYCVTNSNSLSDSNLTRFVAVGEIETIMTSPDGTTWTILNSGITSGDLSSVTYGILPSVRTGLFVTVTMQGEILISPDGITWTSNSWESSRSFYSVAYFNSLSAGQAGQFMAIGYSGLIMTSPDGMTWTKIISGITASLHSVAYGKPPIAQTGIFVTVGSEYTYDSFNPAHPFLVGDTGKILSSPDGTTWTAHYSVANINLQSVTYGNNQFVVVGESGIILTSPDGTTWTQKNSGTTNSLQSVFYAAQAGIFVAVGVNGTILISTAENSEVAFPHSLEKANSNRIKITISNSCISAILPCAISRSQFKVKLFNISGKQIYSATTKVQNGFLKFPAKGIPAGNYIMSILGDKNIAFKSTFVLPK